MSEDRKLTGKVAMVFGGSRGIGAAAARRLAREGANVGLTYVSAPDKAADTVRAIAEQGRAGFAIKADSADPTAISDAVTQVVAQLGRLDIVVVNAGILRMGDLQTVSLQELDLMLNVNVRGVFLAIQAAAAHLSEGGRVITIGWIQRLRDDQGRGGRHGQGNGGGPRPARHHREQHPAGADAHGHDGKPHR
jgi:3-oxoacyl-[acyl-carrier protein] reductase